MSIRSAPVPQPEHLEHLRPRVQPVPARGHGVSVTALAVPDVSAWAAAQLDPGLVGRGVIVFEGRRVVGLSLEARVLGVRAGEALDRARGLVPQAVFLEFDAPTIEATWEAAVQVAYQYTPFLAVEGTGRLYLGELTAYEAHDLALELRAFVGLAASRGTAMLAAFASAEGQARVVSDDRAFLERLPIYVARGFGFEGRVLERLRMFGLRFVGDLHRFTPKQLMAQFGREVGLRLHGLAHEELNVPIPLYRPKDEPSSRIAFDWPVVEPGEFEPLLDKLVLETAEKLGNRVARVVTVSVTTALGTTISRRVLKKPARSPVALFTPARLALETALQPGLEIEAMKVTLGGVMWPVARQDSLFAALERPGVRAAVEAVEARFPGKLGRFDLVNERAYLPEDRYQFKVLNPASLEEHAGRSRRSRGRA